MPTRAAVSGTETHPAEYESAGPAVSGPGSLGVSSLAARLRLSRVTRSARSLTLSRLLASCFNRKFDPNALAVGSECYWPSEWQDAWREGSRGLLREPVVPIQGTGKLLHHGSPAVGLM